jgi:TRAP-type C4-dicarboxylate transport system substrate-binding protein
MAASNICPTCGTGIPTDAPEGLCPKCLAGIALRKQTQANERECLYLRDEPIGARRPGGWYQFRKFAKRNKAIGLGIVAVLVASAARMRQSDLQQQARRSIQEQERAEEEEAAAKEKLAAERAALANARQTTGDEIHARRVAEVNLAGETALRRQAEASERAAEVRHLLVADDRHDATTLMNEHESASFVRAPPTATSNVMGRPRIRINLGTIAPRGSTFHRSLQSMAQEWKTISGGAVRMVVYPDGTMGGDSDMVRLMRVGTLHAALLTAHGLSDIEPSVTGLQSMPLRFRTLDEFDHANHLLRPVVQPRVEAKGFVVLSWVDAGWVRYFSKEPVIWPNDLKTRKVFAWNGDPDQFQLMRDLELSPVALDTGDIQTGLRTGLIDVVAVPPVFALAGGIDAQAPHMLSLNWAPLVGAIVVSRRTWERIPETMHAELLAAAEAAGSEIRAGSRKESADAVAAMEQRGLQVHPVTPEMRATWEAMAESELLPRIRGTLVPEEMFDAVQQIVLRYRPKDTSP